MRAAEKKHSWETLETLGTIAGGGALETVCETQSWFEFLYFASGSSSWWRPTSYLTFPIFPLQLEPHWPRLKYLAQCVTSADISSSLVGGVETSGWHITGLSSAFLAFGNKKKRHLHTFYSSI